ncbi:MAG: VOC family protein, partial [Brevibacterium aurantiacum]
IDLDDPHYPADVERAVALGAEKVAGFAEYGIEWTTLTDPEGNVFDIGRKVPTDENEDPA